MEGDENQLRHLPPAYQFIAIHRAIAGVQPGAGVQAGVPVKADCQRHTDTCQTAR